MYAFDFGISAITHGLLIETLPSCKHRFLGILHMLIDEGSSMTVSFTIQIAVAASEGLVLSITLMRTIQVVRSAGRGVPRMRLTRVLLRDGTCALLHIDT